jgi:hypothetical protein
MRKLPGREKAISMVELKSSYLRQMEAFREARANKRRERDLHIHVKNMHTHMGGRIEDIGGTIEKEQKKFVTSFYCTQYIARYVL